MYGLLAVKISDFQTNWTTTTVTNIDASIDRCHDGFYYKPAKVNKIYSDISRGGQTFQVWAFQSTSNIIHNSFTGNYIFEYGGQALWIPTVNHIRS